MPAPLPVRSTLVSYNTSGFASCPLAAPLNSLQVSSSNTPRALTPFVALDSDGKHWHVLWYVPVYSGTRLSIVGRPTAGANAQRRSSLRYDVLLVNIAEATAWTVDVDIVESSTLDDKIILRHAHTEC